MLNLTQHIPIEDFETAVSWLGNAKHVYIMGLGTSLVLALSFANIEDEHQDAIIAYCLAEQRKQLRLKVKVLGGGTTK